MKKVKINSFFVKSIFAYLIMAFTVLFVSIAFIENPVYRTMHDLFTASEAKNDVAVIVIDNKSIEQYRLPWSRDLYAKIFEYLNEYSTPKVIGFDAVFVTLDKDNPKADEQFFKTLAKSDNIVVGFAGLLYDNENDNELKEYSSDFYNKFKVEIKDLRKNKIDNPYNGFTEFPKPYFDAVKYAGSVNNTYDDFNNNFAIYGTQLITVDNKTYPSLALRMYMLMNKSTGIILTDKELTVDNTDLSVPIQSSRKAVRNYTHFYNLQINSEYSHKKYSASDIINSLELIKQGKKPVINPQEFAGKAVLIGGNVNATGAGMNDVMESPIQKFHPGVDIQATNLENLINNEFVTPTSELQDFVIIAILMIAVIFFIIRFSFFQSLTFLIFLAVLYLLFTVVCFKNNIAPNVVTPLVLQLVTMVFAYSYRFILEGKNKEKIKQAMGKYLSQDIMQNVVKNIDDIKLGGKKAVVTVLFADIRGFTSISEQLSAEEVSIILNEYFTEIEPIISKYNGVINKFIGDAVMAIFGEPIQDINHAKNAVLCANEMLKAVDKLRDKWLFEGKPKIEIGIGINTGEAFVGNIGSEKRLEYTVIGDMVNLASRIESYNKVYKTNFLISSSTYSHVNNIADVIKISEVTIRGKSKKMDIYEVLRLS